MQTNTDHQSNQSVLMRTVQVYVAAAVVMTVGVFIAKNGGEVIDHVLESCCPNHPAQTASVGILSIEGLSLLGKAKVGHYIADIVGYGLHGYGALPYIELAQHLVHKLMEWLTMVIAYVMHTIHHWTVAICKYAFVHIRSAWYQLTHH